MFKIGYNKSGSLFVDKDDGNSDDAVLVLTKKQLVQLQQSINFALKSHPNVKIFDFEGAYRNYLVHNISLNWPQTIEYLREFDEFCNKTFFSKDGLRLAIRQAQKRRNFYGLDYTNKISRIKGLRDVYPLGLIEAKFVVEILWS